MMINWCSLGEPSTCHPVGSTIAHEIGHSFQYQVYADKVNKQGYPADLHHGFRYGFGPDGAGGCCFLGTMCTMASSARLSGRNVWLSP